MKQLIKNNLIRLKSAGFFYIVGATLFSKLFLFISNIVVIQFAPKHEYGVYEYSLNILSFFLISFSLGMTSGVLQICSENNNNKSLQDGAYNYGAKIGILYNLILGFIILTIAELANFPIAGASTYLILLAFIPFFESINEFQVIYFRSTLNNKNYSYAYFFRTSIFTILSVTGVVFFEINGLITARYMAAIVTAVFVSKYLMGKIPKIKSSIDKTTKKWILKISLISMCNNGLTSLMFILDTFIIGLMISNAEVIAEYRVAILIPIALEFIPATIIMFAYPYFAMNKDNKKWLVKKVPLIFGVMALINALISIVLFVFADSFIALLFGEEYLGITNIFRVAVVSYFFSGTFRTIAGNLLVTQRKLLYNLIISIVSVILNLCLNIVLIQQIGVIGAAWTTLIVTSSLGIVSTLYFLFIIKKK